MGEAIAEAAGHHVRADDYFEPFLYPAEWVSVIRRIAGTNEDRGERRFFHSLARRKVVAGIPIGNARTSARLYSIRDAVTACVAWDLRAGGDAGDVVCAMARSVSFKAGDCVADGDGGHVTDVCAIFGPLDESPLPGLVGPIRLASSTRIPDEVPRWLGARPVYIYPVGGIVWAFAAEYFAADADGRLEARRALLERAAHAES